jgi:hypothetical protein
MHQLQKRPTALHTTVANEAYFRGPMDWQASIQGFMNQVLNIPVVAIVVGLAAAVAVALSMVVTAVHTFRYFMNPPEDSDLKLAFEPTPEPSPPRPKLVRKPKVKTVPAADPTLALASAAPTELSALVEPSAASVRSRELSTEVPTVPSSPTKPVVEMPSWIAVWENGRWAPLPQPMSA